MNWKIIDFDQGWDCMQKGINKLKRILEGVPESHFSSEEYMMLYTTIYNMCTQKPPNNFSQQLYHKYKEAFYEYIRSTVLPSLNQKHDELMLRELVQRWSNHKVMVRWLSHLFHYLDCYFIARRNLPPLNEVGLTCFRDLVYMAVRANVRKAVIALIDKEREGEQIDRSLLKNVLDIFVEIGMGEMEQYEQDFEVQMLEDTANYYKSKGTNWIEIYSCPDYMLKVEDCLRRERDRVSHYLHSSTEQKLVEKVRHELLMARANFKLSLVDQVNRKMTQTKGTEHEFDAEENDWGFTNFIPLYELHDPRNGFIVNDTCVIEAEISVTKSEHENQVDQAVSIQVCAEPIKHSENPLPKEMSTTSFGELVDFRGLGKLEKAFVPLLEEVCSQHPSLIDSQQRRSRRFVEWAFTALGRVLHFLKTKKVKDMNDEACNDLQILWDELETFKFDLTWLEPLSICLGYEELHGESCAGEKVEGECGCFRNGNKAAQGKDGCNRGRS